MSQLERARQLIALNHVNDKGDAQTREFVDALLADRSARLDETASLHGKMGRLKDDVLDMHRTGLSPGARRVVGLGVAALVVVSGITGITLLLGGLVPLTHGIRVSLGMEPMPPRAGPSWVGPMMSFTALGPPKIILAVNKTFEMMPTAVDTGDGRMVSLRFVDGDLSILQVDAQNAQALAIARFVWRLKERPARTEQITVQVERPMRVPGQVGVSHQYVFHAAELNGR